MESLNKALNNKQEEEEDSVINDFAAEFRPAYKDVCAVKTESYRQSCRQYSVTSLQLSIQCFLMLYNYKAVNNAE
jgi:hypothetical protein